jgi:signal transduction histidine kinase
MNSRDPFDPRSPFEGLERARRNRLLITAADFLVIIAVPVLLPFLIMFVTIASWQTAYIFFLTILSVPAALMAKSLARRDQAERGAGILLVYFLLMVGSNGVMIEGLFPAVAPSYAWIVVMAGMVLGARGGYGLGFLAAILWAGGANIIETDLVSPISLEPLLLGALGSVIIMTALLMVAFLTQAGAVDLRRALNDATYDLVQANRQLEEASKLKSQFMARTSHELRTPLSAIIVFTDLALRKVYGPLTEKQADSHKRVLHNAKRLNALINDLLDLAKIEAGEMEIVEETVHLNQMVETVKTTLEADAQEKGLAFSIAVDTKMPATITGDENRICQILLNLTHNAIKFTDEGEVKVSIAPVDENKWKMTVKDTGRGIPENDMKVIFDEFQQLGRPVVDSKTHGTGLGLSIIRHLVQLMNGNINLESDLGKGSKFEILLPLKTPEVM